MRDLHVGRGVTWPVAIASQAIGVLGMRGAGKSNLGRVVAEELFASSVPFVVFDPIGNWYGIRAGRDGRPGGGVPIPIFGGEHGDLELDRTSGHKIADLILDRRLSCVLDLSHAEFSESDKQRFLAEFGDRLFRRKSRESGWLTLIMEEADDYAPQPRSGGGVKGEAAKTLGMFQRLVRRGRFKGLGALLITQRSAAVNKDLLYMVGTLIAFRTTGPRDQDAIAGWVKYNAIGEKVLESLPGLEDGEAWVIAPEALGKIERVRFRHMNTYDTGATPEHGGQAKPATLADIDVPALSKELAAAVERAKAEDPRELRRRIAELERELKAKPVAAAAAAVRTPKRVEVPVLKDAQVKRLEAAAARIDRAMVQLGKWAQLFTGTEREVRNVGAEISVAIDAAQDAMAGVRKPSALGAVERAGGSEAGRPGVVGGGSAGRVVPARPSVVPRANGKAHGGVEQRILDALAELEQMGARRPGREMVAFLAGYTHLQSKGFVNAMSALRTGGLVDYPDAGTVALTAEGRAQARAPERPRTAAELQGRVTAMLGGASSRILTPLIEAYPQALAREDVAAKAGYGHLQSKGFVNAISRLRTLGFVDYPDRGSIVATPVLFLEGGA